jgi:hypothetical protein
VPRVHFWRDKQERELDFILPRKRDDVDVVECKWSADAADDIARALTTFRASYTKGRNIVVAPITAAPYERTIAGLKVTLMSPSHLLADVIETTAPAVASVGRSGRKRRRAR